MSRTSKTVPQWTATIVLAFFGCTSVVADEPASPAGPETAQETDDASDAAPGEALSPEQQAANTIWDAARAALVRGPADVALRDQAGLAVPDGFGFIPAHEAEGVMRLMGNTVDERFIGLVFPLNDEDHYFVSLEFEDSGYIKDDEARDWDADALLQSLKDGTEAANDERAERGIPPIQVTRWIESPTYDSGAHRLVWSAEAILKDGDDPDPTVNYNTYFLGREGYISANLITSASTINGDKVDAGALLRGVTFDEGKRYTDFDSKSDKVAAYGLTALIGGIAAKKLGLIAAAAAFVVKFAKVIGVAAVAAVAGARKYFSRKSGPISS